MLQRLIQAEHRIPTFIVGIVKELVMHAPNAPAFLVTRRAGGHDHVIDTLERIASRFRLLPNEVEVFLERTDPVFLAKLIKVLSLSNQRNDFTTVAHG